MRYIFALVIVMVPFLYGCAVQKRVSVADEKVVRLHAVALFDFDSNTIQKDMIPVLNGVAEKMERDPNITVVLEGHTDKIGRASYNEVLAEKRARAVGAYLSQEGVGNRRMTFISKGEREPADSRNTKAAYKKNRRVEINQL